VPWEAGVGCGRIWGGGAGFLRLRHGQASLDLGIGSWLVCLAYEPRASITFLSQQISH
jgi:hypothetical protein